MTLELYVQLGFSLASSWADPFTSLHLHGPICDMEIVIIVMQLTLEHGFELCGSTYVWIFPDTDGTRL